MWVMIVTLDWYRSGGSDVLIGTLDLYRSCGSGLVQVCMVEVLWWLVHWICTGLVEVDWYRSGGSVVMIGTLDWYRCGGSAVIGTLDRYRSCESAVSDDWYTGLVQVLWKCCGRETATWLCWMLSCWPSVSTHTSGRTPTTSVNSSLALVSNDTTLYASSTGVALLSTQQQLLVYCAVLFRSACAVLSFCHVEVIFSDYSFT